ncbi:MAG: helix-turn-helix transcriptional regulator [Kiritimatiellales bacterium]
MPKETLILHKDDKYGSITRHEAPETIAAPHHHEHLEINFVERGQAKYNVNDRIYNLEARGIVFLFPAQEHVLYDRSSDFQMWNITVRQSFLNTLCKSRYLMPLKARDPQEYFCRRFHLATARLYEKLLPDVAAQQKTHPVIYRLGLGYLVAGLWKDFHENATINIHQPVSPHIQKIIYLLSHSNDHKNLDVLAGEFNISPSQISRMFKKEMGISITEFRNRVKLDRFINLMFKHPKYDLLTLAMDSGFGSYTQFFRIFRQQMGMTPEEFRKKTDF